MTTYLTAHMSSAEDTFISLQVLSTLQNLETLDLEDNDLNTSLPDWHLSSLGHLSGLQCLNLAQ